MSLQESIAAGLPGCLRERVRHLASQFAELKADISSWEAWHRAELIPPSLGSSLGPAWVPQSPSKEDLRRASIGIRWSRYQNETEEQYQARLERRRAARQARRMESRSRFYAKRIAKREAKAAAAPPTPPPPTMEEFIAMERARKDKRNAAKRARNAAKAAGK